MSTSNNVKRQIELLRSIKHEIKESTEEIQEVEELVKKTERLIKKLLRQTGNLS